MMIGIDFDNTIACYDRAFAFAAVEMGLLPEADGLDKRAVRDRLRAAGGETDWMRLQGRVYGFYIERAQLFDGFAAFVRQARAAGCDLRIISHKSRYGHFDPERIDLIEAACGWMARRGFFAPHGLGFAGGHVGFYPTRADKLAAIATAGCDVFIDDLPEVLHDAAFPAACRPLLFAPADVGGDWAGIGKAVFS
jgi:hypothetical protein